MRFLACLFSCVLAWSVAGAELHFDFGEYSEGTTLTNFHTALLGGGIPPVWKIISTEVPSGFTAPGNKTPLMNHSTVLAQTSEDTTSERYPMYIYDGATFKDFTFSTRFKAVSGITEQMAGMVFRYQNSSNFYVVRVSVLGNNIGFYPVANGIRLLNPIATAVTIPPGTWHKLAVQCDGNNIMMFLDDKLVMPAVQYKDLNNVADGKIGFWTKSDAVTYFSEATLNYTPLIPPAQQMITAMIQKRSTLLGLQIYTLTTNNTTQVLASKNLSEVGQPGTDAELAAIQNGTVSLGREHGTVVITMPLHDRNGEYIAAMRVKLKSFFGETQDNAVTRARMVQKDLEQLCPAAENLRD